MRLRHVALGLAGAVGLALTGCMPGPPDLRWQPTGPRLGGPEIAALLDGRAFDFVGHSEPYEGWAEWNLAAGWVRGVRSHAGAPFEAFAYRAWVEGDLLCLDRVHSTVCRRVHAVEDGFATVRDDGMLHAVWSPAAL